MVHDRAGEPLIARTQPVWRWEFLGHTEASQPIFERSGIGDNHRPFGVQMALLSGRASST